MTSLNITNIEKQTNLTKLPSDLNPFLLEWAVKDLYCDSSKSILVQYFGTAPIYYNNIVSQTKLNDPQTIQFKNPSQDLVIQLFTEYDYCQCQYNNIRTQKVLFSSSSQFNISLCPGNVIHLFTIEKNFLEQLIGYNCCIEVPELLEQHNLISSKLNTVLLPYLNPTLIRLKMLDLIIDLLSLYSKSCNSYTISKNQSSDHNIIEEIKERIIQKPNIKDFHYSRLAKEYLSNRSTLSRNFKTTYGTTLTQFLHAQIMINAKQLLLETTMSVTEISEYFGYNQATNFSRHFYKQFRQQPHEFRK